LLCFICSNYEQYDVDGDGNIGVGRGDVDGDEDGHGHGHEDEDEGGDDRMDGGGGGDGGVDGGDQDEEDDTMIIIQRHSSCTSTDRWGSTRPRKTECARGPNAAQYAQPRVHQSGQPGSCPLWFAALFWGCSVPINTNSCCRYLQLCVMGFAG